MINKLIRNMDKKWTIVLGGLAFFAFIINVIIFYPGYMSSDSISMLEQAMGISRPSDLAPVAMTLVWRIFITITGQISSMLIFQLLILWVSLFLLSVYVYKITVSKKLSLSVIMIGLLPFVLNISGVMWRDNQMTFALVLAMVITLYYKFVGSKKWRSVMLAASIALIIYAFLVRYNAIFAVVPLLFLTIKQSGLVRRLRWQIGFAIMACLIAYGLSPLVNKIMNTTKNNPAVLLMIDDIVHVLPDRELADLPISEASSSAADVIYKINKCSDDRKIFLGAYGACTDDSDRYMMQATYADKVKASWFDTVWRHPIGYFAYRLKAFVIFLFPPAGAHYVWQEGINPNKIIGSNAFDGFEFITSQYVNRFSYRYFSFLFVPWFWFVLSVCLFVNSRKKAEHSFFVSMMSISSIFYILGYFPSGATVDYRYIYWPVLASVFCLVLISSDRFNHKRKSKKAST